MVRRRRDVGAVRELVERCYGGGGGSVCVAMRLVRDGSKIAAGRVV